MPGSTQQRRQDGAWLRDGRSHENTHPDGASADVLERITDGFVALDKDWRYTYVNRRATEILGRDSAELIGEPLGAEFPAGGGPTFRAECERALAEQRPIVLEAYHALWRRWFENRVYPSPQGLYILFEDITERMRARLWRSGQNEVMEALLKNRPMADVLAALVRAVEPQTAGAIGCLLLVDAAGERLSVGAAPSLPHGLIRALEGLPTGPAGGACGTAVRERALVVIEDLETDPRAIAHRELARRYGLRACWSQPFFSANGDVLGTFALYYREPRRPDADERRAIEDAARLAALAIETARARHALEASERRFRAAVEHAPIGIALVAPDGRWLRVNAAVCDILGYTEAELLARTFRDITHADDLPEHAARLEALLAGRISAYTLEQRYLRVGGAIVWANLTVSLVRRPDGSPDYVVVIIEDIGERKRFDAELRASGERLRRILDGLLVYVGMLSRDGRLIEANEPPLRRAGLSRDDVIGQPLAETPWFSYSGEAQMRLRTAIERAAAGEFVRYDERVHMAGDGLIDIDFAIAPLRDEAGQVMYLIPSAVDITDRKRTEERLRTSQRELEVLSRRLLLAQEAERRSIARELHDEIGQLLTVVKLHLQAVREQRGVPPALERAIEESMESIDRVVASVRNLTLDLRPPMLDDLGLIPTIRSLVQRHAGRPGADIRLSLPAEPLPPLGSAVEFACFRILQEALTNATRHAGARHIDVAVGVVAGRIELSVRDDGAGFEVGATRVGTGLLGMRERARLAGGEVEFDSAPGRGTTVRARFAPAQGAGQ